MAEALFIREGDTYHPTRLTEGPWSPEAQHGGPPAALLGGAIDRAPALAEMMVARIMVDLLRPVPLKPMQLTTEVIREGKQVQVVEATLVHEDTPVARAVGLRLRKKDIEVPIEAVDAPELPGPETGRPPKLFRRVGAFGGEAMEISVIDGDFTEPGPGRAWFRLRVPVIDGSETTPVEMACAASDFGNGLSSFDPEREWLFINPDLEVRFSRPPSGEWILLDSRSSVHPVGTGLAESTLYDLSGRFGKAAQSLLVEPLTTL